MKAVIVWLHHGKTLDASEEQQPLNDIVYFTIADKWTECKGFHEEPQCAAVYLVDCCVPNEDNEMIGEQLIANKVFLHLK